MIPRMSGDNGSTGKQSNKKIPCNWNMIRHKKDYTINTPISILSYTNINPSFQIHASPKHPSKTDSCKSLMSLI